MAMSLAKGARVTLSKVDGFADGVAVKHVSNTGVLRLGQGGWAQPGARQRPSFPPSPAPRMNAS